MAGSMMKKIPNNRRRLSGRPIPKRGQVKMGIVVGLANSVASIFSRTSNSARSTSSPSHFPR
ncbi:hypothetical protein HN51_013175 [Arachis hypogaea]|uniref:Uncharacterized protein n=1 Tax=Arachis hypogaea TaxID=3818 RepID=A0A445DRE8_ARAHY|nr:hypothetical protein Ahy_A03g011675 [Arachis hypogaea]